jgi:endogenous inhibitor of DNA gyrase (YacG/DUF329 family)
MGKTVSCPHCGKAVVWGPASPWRPFCSERCRLIDLGEWLDENRRIVDTPDDQTDDQADAEPTDGGPPQGAH